MIKLVKKADAFWAGNGFGNQAAEWVVKGAEHINVWSSGGSTWNVTNRETGERILRNKHTRAFTLELLEDKMPELAVSANPAKRIADMDVSNLTDEQIEVIRQLTLRAEDGFDKRANLADNDDVRNIASSHAEACMRLLGRLREEKETRTEAA